MIALALAAALLAQDVQEQEPNNERDKASQGIAPGATFTGSLDPEGDQDWVHVECDKETVCSLALEVAKSDRSRLEIHLPRAAIATTARDGTTLALRVRIPKGRTPVRLVGRAKSYRFRVSAEETGERQEIEPNNDSKEAHEILQGETWRGAHSGFTSELDCYRFKAASAGPRELVFKCGPKFRGYVSLFGSDPLKQVYYHINGHADEYHFFPVLDPGEWNLHLTVGDTAVGDSYEISVNPMGGKVTEEERKAAQAAIDRAVRHLQAAPGNPLGAVSTSAESMALAALSEGAGAKERREALDRDFVSRLEGRFQKVEGGPRAVYYVERNIYTHAMATLGLAEAAANGSEKGKELAIRAADFLVATQNTERKPAVWKGPIDRRAREYGGWRYAPDENRSDLSIVGWCIIALTAVDAAGLKVEGLRDSIEAALHYVRTTGDQEGYGYEHPKGGSNIHNSIGALMMLLYGEETAALRFATRELDRHLWSATQVDRGDAYPFYYLYYATRAQYLRSGEVWETWRATALRQLLRRQKEDGSWAAIGFENAPGARWTTALGLMMLRLCLNEAPKYLRVEAKGF